ncbi:MAG: CcmD family protein [Myxococcota bacterium]|jgi:CcmD family protein
MSYLIASYAVTIAAIGFYGWSLLRERNSLSKH